MRKLGYVFVFWILFLSTDARTVKIGVINGPDDNPKLNSAVFWQNAGNTPDMILNPVVEHLPWWGVLELSKAVCDVAKKGAKAVVAPGLAATWLHPILESQAELMGLAALSTDNLLPDTSRAAAAVIGMYGWQSFTFIYDTESGADHLQRILRHMNDTPMIEAFFRANDATEAARFVSMLPLNSAQVLLATSERLADDLIAHLETTNRADFQGILLTPVATVQRTRFRSFTTLAKFSMSDTESPMFKQFGNSWKTMSNHTQRRVRPEKVFPESAVIGYDMSRVMSALFSSSDKWNDGPIAQDFDCMNFSTGIEVPALSKMTALNGLTGNIQFNNKGQRTAFSFDVMEVTPWALKKIAHWSESTGLQVTDSQRILTPSSAPLQTLPAIRVTSIQNAPFLVRGSAGGREWEGFVMDLIDQLSSVLGRPFRLQHVKDFGYGRLKEDGSWSGMIGELIRGEADIAIADLTKNPLRATVVDFGHNFLTIGLNILIHKPPSEEGPTEGPVWGPWGLFAGGLLVAGTLAAAAGYSFSRFLGPPDRVRALESKSTDNLSPCGSFWFVTGALMRRDTGIYPRTLGHRLWAVVWWIFCFLVLTAYVSSLTSQLIATRRAAATTTHAKKTSHEVLQDLLEKGFPAIGVVRSGSTMQFFKDSSIGAYRDFGDYLIRRPDVVSRSSAEGAARVRASEGRYAFVMESISSEFFANQQPCETQVAQGYLNTINYAIAMQKNSPLRNDLDHAMLTLIESGTLRDIYEKWWHNFTSECDDPNLDILQTIYQNSMTLKEVSGVFYFFIGSLVLSAVVAVLEYFYIKKRSLSLD